VRRIFFNKTPAPTAITILTVDRHHQTGCFSFGFSSFRAGEDWRKKLVGFGRILSIFLKKNVGFSDGGSCFWESSVDKWFWVFCGS